MTFNGIPVAALDFYDDLELNNNKSWWDANKHIYDEQVKAPLLALADALEPEFGPGKFFRPYRDVRFSKDKTPYKTHQGIWFGDTSRYFHLSAIGLFVGGGYWRTSSEQVARLREAIVDDRFGPTLEQALAEVKQAKLNISGEQLARVPTGFDKEHPRAELLRYKTLMAGREFGTPAWLSTKRVQTEIVKAWRAMDSLILWLDTHVGRETNT